MSVPSIVYTMLDDNSPVRGRPESSNAGFGRPDSFMPTHLELISCNKLVIIRSIIFMVE